MLIFDDRIKCISHYGSHGVNKICRHFFVDRGTLICCLNSYCLVFCIKTCFVTIGTYDVKMKKHYIALMHISTLSILL